jgi:hypothetical protein
MKSNSQAGQDLFVLSCLNYKRNGTFLEIGSNDAISINNSYLLEKDYGWTGIMVEYEPRFLSSYKIHRPKSTHVIADATKIDYTSYRKSLPQNVDYLQIDLEVENASTIATLRKVRDELMDTHRFATVTFEHDIYRGDFYNTRAESRSIFDSKGYVRVFSDVKNKNSAFEDWYVHPDLVDMAYINTIQTDSSLEYTELIKRFRVA